MSTYVSELLLTVGIGYVDALLWSRGKGLGVTVLRTWSGVGTGPFVSHVGTALEPVVDHQLFLFGKGPQSFPLCVRTRFNVYMRFTPSTHACVLCAVAKPPDSRRNN